MKAGTIYRPWDDKQYDQDDPFDLDDPSTWPLDVRKVQESVAAARQSIRRWHLLPRLYGDGEEIADAFAEFDLAPLEDMKWASIHDKEAAIKRHGELSKHMDQASGKQFLSLSFAKFLIFL